MKSENDTTPSPKRNPRDERRAEFRALLSCQSNAQLAAFLSAAKSLVADQQAPRQPHEVRHA